MLPRVVPFLALALVTSAAAAQAPRGAGNVEERTVFDSSYHRPRRVWVYTPPGYDPRATLPYPLIVAFDGAVYLDTIPLPMILDTLLATRRAPPFVAVLVDDSSSGVRIADLGINCLRMVQFLGKQLMPMMRRG